MDEDTRTHIDLSPNPTLARGSRSGRGERQALSLASLEDWGLAWRSDVSATYYQSPQWANIWAELTPDSEVAALTIALQSDLDVIVPLVRQRIFRGLVTQYLSSPSGTQTGWLASRPLTSSEVQELVGILLTTLPDMDWKTSPLQHLPTAMRSARLAHARVVDLRSGPDVMRAAWSKGHKAAYNKGLRLGVTVRAGDEQRDWQRFWDLHQASATRWRAAGESVTSRYNEALFDAIQRAHGTRLWVAEYAGEVISAAVFLYSPRTAIYFHGATDADSFSLRPANVLLADVMFRGAADGLDWVDLGASGGHDNVDEFKRRFGATAAPFATFTRMSQRQRLLRGLRGLPGRWFGA